MYRSPDVICKYDVRGLPCNIFRRVVSEMIRGCEHGRMVAMSKQELNNWYICWFTTAMKWQSTTQHLITQNKRHRRMRGQNDSHAIYIYTAIWYYLPYHHYTYRQLAASIHPIVLVLVDSCAGKSFRLITTVLYNTSIFWQQHWRREDRVNHPRRERL